MFWDLFEFQKIPLACPQQIFWSAVLLCLNAEIPITTAPWALLCSVGYSERHSLQIKRSPLVSCLTWFNRASSGSTASCTCQERKNWASHACCWQPGFLLWRTISQWHLAYSGNLLLISCIILNILVYIEAVLPRLMIHYKNEADQINHGPLFWLEQYSLNWKGTTEKVNYYPIQNYFS